MLLENALLTLVNTIIFLLFALVFWLLPGLKLIPHQEKKATLDRVFLAATFGFALFAITVYITRLLGLPFWISYIPFLYLSAQKLRTWKWKMPSLPKISRASKILIVLILAGVFIQGVVLMKSAIRTSEGLRFLEISAHDSLQHVYLINELKENFPPRHPGFSQVVIKNYHFLFDLTIASLAKYLPLSTFELYFRVLPAFISVLFSLSLFVMARRLTHSEWIANVAVFLGLFSGNAAWFFKLFRGPEFEVSANNFMLDPIIDLMQNPMAVLVFPLMLAGIIGLQNLEKKASVRWTMFTATTFGVMIGFKTWGGSLMLAALPLAALWMSLRKKRHDLWKVWLIALGISTIIFLPVYDAQTAANPVYSPGWLLKRMVEDPDRYNKVNYYFLEQHYLETKNILGLIRVNLTEVVIFLFGNLWVRIIGLIYLVHLLKKRTATAVFMGSVVALSLSLPLLFNQGRMAYDIIQYGPYSLVLMSIFTAAAIPIISKFFPKALMGAFVILLLILSVPSNKKSLVVRYTSDTFLVSNEELEGYRFLREETDPKSIVMVYPSEVNDSILKVAALSQRPTYFSGKSFARITGNEYDERGKEWRSFFKDIDPDRRGKVIRNNSIDYLFLRRSEDRNFNPAGLNLKKTLENEEIVVYKIK